VPLGFSVTGQVDIVGPDNPFGIDTQGGIVVDLDGSPGPGEIETLARYFFEAGDRIVLSFILGGSQRAVAEDDVYARLLFDVPETKVRDFDVTGALGPVNLGNLTLGPAYTVESTIAGSAPFALTSISFTAVAGGTLGFAIGTTSADNIGPLVAGITLDIAPIPLPAAGGALVLGLGLLAALRRKRA
jgi:hypothetical protein